MQRPVRLAQQLAQGRAGDEGLQAAAVAAAADRTLRVDEDVADLAGDAARAAERPAVDDQAGADARRQPQVHEHPRAAPGAEGRLAERADVRVVVEVHRRGEPPLELGDGVQPAPAGQDRLRAHEARLAVDRPGQPDAGGQQAPGAHAGRVDQLAGQARGGVERLVGAGVDVELDLLLGEHVVGQRGDGYAQMVVAEVDAEQRARGGVEGEEHRQAAALAAVGDTVELLALAHQARGLEVGDEARDGRPAEPRGARDVRPRHGSAGAERVDHAEAIALAERLQRAAGSDRTHPGDPLRSRTGLSRARTNSQPNPL